MTCVKHPSDVSVTKAFFSQFNIGFASLIVNAPPISGLFLTDPSVTLSTIKGILSGGNPSQIRYAIVEAVTVNMIYLWQPQRIINKGGSY